MSFPYNKVSFPYLSFVISLLNVISLPQIAFSLHCHFLTGTFSLFDGESLIKTLVAMTYLFVVISD